MGPGALANEVAVERSPSPIGATGAMSVTSVLAVWMVSGRDGKREHPRLQRNSAQIAKWGQTLERDCTVWPEFFRLNCQVADIEPLNYGDGGSRTEHRRRKHATY